MFLGYFVRTENFQALPRWRQSIVRVETGRPPLRHCSGDGYVAAVEMGPRSGIRKQDGVGFKSRLRLRTLMHVEMRL